MSSDLNTKQLSMQAIKIPFEQVPQFSKRDIAYTNADPALRSFYKYEVSMEAFAKLISDKAQNTLHRKELVEAVTQQYKSLSAHPKVIDNITALADNNTFTIITAHQPSLFTGPLYYIYKIISAINLTEKLKAHYPDYHFVPVFITGGEDHDFEEINHLSVFGKQVEWTNNEQGAVGQMATDTLAPVLDELEAILGTSENAERIFQSLKRAYTEHPKYGASTIAFT
ncbi:MAG: bacillithiol biosynthesis BshC, partial [Bacteroidota bacterium]